MEGAPLRFVPFRPSGPVDPAKALGHVGEVLPGLDETARKALAQVDLGGRSLTVVADELAIGRGDLAEALARARKELRRAAFPLSAAGWCERAERLISDALDTDLDSRRRRLLDGHLRHCHRCVEHERRLAQARDSLARGFVERYQARPEPAPPAVPAPDLRVVEEAIPEVEERVGEVEQRIASFEQRLEASQGQVVARMDAVEQRLAEISEQLAALARARHEAVPPVEAPPQAPADEPPVEAPPVEEPPVQAPPIEAPAVQSPAADMPAVATPAAIGPARRHPEEIGPWLWRFLFFLAVLLAVAVLVVTAMGVSGVERLFYER